MTDPKTQQVLDILEATSTALNADEPQHLDHNSGVLKLTAVLLGMPGDALAVPAQLQVIFNRKVRSTSAETVLRYLIGTDVVCQNGDWRTGEVGVVVDHVPDTGQHKVQFADGEFLYLRNDDLREASEADRIAGGIGSSGTAVTKAGIWVRGSQLRYHGTKLLEYIGAICVVEGHSSIDKTYRVTFSGSDGPDERIVHANELSWPR